MRAVLAACVVLGLGACREPPDDRPTHGEAAPVPITSTAAIALARATHFGETGAVSGKTPAAAGGARARLFAGVVDSAGRLIAAGESQRPGGGHRGLIVRLTIDGALDPSFGGGDGIVLAPDDGDRSGFEPALTANDAFYAVQLDREGRILVAGKSGVAGRAKALVARYLANGALDHTFGDAEGKGTRRRGFVIGMGDEYLDDQFSGVRPESSYPDERFHAVDVDAEGRIVTAGVTSDLNKSWLADTEACGSWLPSWLCRTGFYTTLIARWTPAGALDTSFNDVGYVTGTGGRGRWWLGRHDEYLAVRVLADGRIVAAGFVTGDRFNDRRSLLAAYLPDGKLDDDGFGTTATRGHVLGPERARAGGTREELDALAIDAQGKLIVAGRSWDAAGKPRALIARKLPNGSPDPTFAEAGYVLEELAARATVRATIDERGMIVATLPPRMLRFTPSGAHDEAFEAPPVGTTTSAVAIHDLIADRFGKIYVIGASGPAWHVARYTREGCPDRPGECAGR